jgi:hypothetical protein
MAQLKDFLGGVLRDVVEARVTADLVSRDVAEEYKKDELLSAFPVPRAEIREVSAQLRFAVAAVEAPMADSGAARAGAVKAWTAQVAKLVYESAVLKSQLRDELLRVIEAKGLDVPGQLQAAATQVILAEPKVIDQFLQGDSDTLFKIAVNETYRVFTTMDDDLRKLLQRIGLTPIKAQIQEIVVSQAASLKELLAKSEDLAGKKAARVDLAVTRRELADAPEHILSSVAVTVALRNYEWTKTEVDGKEITRLSPE